MITPSVWSLNFRTLAFLKEEAAIWEKKFSLAYGQDRTDAGKYLEAVRAELAQREKAYSGGAIGAALAALSAPFEAFGGSSGPGAPGAAGSIYESASETATGIADTARKYSYVIIGAAFLLVGFLIWLRFKK